MKRVSLALTTVCLLGVPSISPVVADEAKQASQDVSIEARLDIINTTAQRYDGYLPSREFLTLVEGSHFDSLALNARTVAEDIVGSNRSRTSNALLGFAPEDEPNHERTAGNSILGVPFKGQFQSTPRTE